MFLPRSLVFATFVRSEMVLALVEGRRLVDQLQLSANKLCRHSFALFLSEVALDWPMTVDEPG